MCFSDGIYLCTVNEHVQCGVCHALVSISVLHFLVARTLSVVFALVFWTEFICVQYTVNFHVQCVVCHALVLICVLHFFVARKLSVVFVFKRLFLDGIYLCTVNENVQCIACYSCAQHK